MNDAGQGYLRRQVPTQLVEVRQARNITQQDVGRGGRLKQKLATRPVEMHYVAGATLGSPPRPRAIRKRADG